MARIALHPVVRVAIGVFTGFGVWVGAGSPFGAVGAMVTMGVFVFLSLWVLMLWNQREESESPLERLRGETEERE